MAEGKKSFLLYVDIIHTVEHLSCEKAGKLFKLILEYVNDRNPANPKDPALLIAFEPIRQQLKRDLKKYEDFVKKQSDNGKLGGRPTSQKTQAFPEKPKKADSDSVSVSDSVNERDILVQSAEKEILNNQIWFEKILMATGKMPDEGREILRMYHLYLVEKDKYPMKRKSVFAGFEKWLRNEKKFNNGHSTNQASSKHSGTATVLASLKQDYAGRK